MNYKIVFLDIDGTLLNSSHKITDITKKCILKLSNEFNIKFVLISARMPKAMYCFADELKINNILAGYGGSLIIENGKIILNKIIPSFEIETMYKYAKEYKIHMSIYKQDKWFVEYIDKTTEKESQITEITPEIENFDSLLKNWRKKETGSNKILFISETNKIIKFKEFLESLNLSCNFYLSKDNYLEAVPYQVSKENSIKFICQKFNISKDETIAIGDSENDIGMIAYAGKGIAMGNSPDIVKKNSDFITKTNDEDGVVFALEKFILNKI